MPKPLSAFPTRRAFLCSALAAFGLLTAGGLNAADEAADVIFENGAVYTVNPKQEWAEAVAVKGRKIVYVGDNAGAAKFKGPGTRVIDLKGRMLTPGFVEGHIHPVLGAPFARGVNVTFSTREEILDKLRKYAATAPNRGLIDGLVRGTGWRYSAFPITGPTKEDLDAIWPDDPVYLGAIDGHTGWVNSKALEKAGITKDTPPAVPGFSYYQKDPKTGEPTGYVVEGPAIMQLLGIISPLTQGYVVESLEEWLPKASAAGITGVFDAGMPILSSEVGLAIYTDLEKQGKLPFRVVGSYYHNDPAADPVPRIEALRAQFQSELVQASVLKLMMDGVDSSGTAALLEPYADNPKSRGDVIFSQRVANSIVRRADAKGIDVHIHCIGDRAARQALDAFEAAIKANPPRDRRNVVAHNQLTDPADIPRFGKLGVIAEFSGQWHCRDDGYLDSVTIPRWGAERANRQYRIGEILRSGARISLGTDWPAGGNSIIYRPLHAIQVAVTRQTVDKPEEEPLPPLEDRLTLAEALRANTMGSAYQIRLEDKIGSIEVGKLADLIVLEKNLFKIDPHDIAATKVDMTMMNGRFTHGD